MKKTIYYFLVFAFWMSSFYYTLSAQTCLPDGIVFSTQAEVDSFQINYPDCTEILGTVLITGTDITNLAVLNVITFIEGSLRVNANDSLLSLSGLENLNAIGNLEIANNKNLTSLNALSNLSTINSGITLTNNDALSSLQGLENISNLEGHVMIFSNEALTSIDGLESLSNINGSIGISYNNVLTSINALNNLSFVGGLVDISGNNVLASLDGLDNLTSIGVHLYIFDNDNLTSIAALQNLTSIGGNLEIDGNANLGSIDGLGNIDPSTITELWLFENSNLSVCDVPSICDYLDSGEFAVVQGNAFGCTNIPQVVNACEMVSHNEDFSDANFPIQVSPNPTNGIIQINANNIKNWNINIRNVMGKLLKSQQLSENEQIDLSFLPNGLYLLELHNNYHVFTESIIKK